MTDLPFDHPDERVIIAAAMALLNAGTSNSMDPVHRKSWSEDREFVMKRLGAILGDRQVGV